jgi:sporulation protein YlmC with PRC-barrel domain
MKFAAVLIGAASVAALAACANNERREMARMEEPRPAPITSPTAREIPPRDTQRTETARVAPAPRASAKPATVGPMAHELNLATLIGTDVKDPAGQTIGEIDDVLLDSAGRVDAVIVTVGGFMGMGGRDVEVRWSDLKSIDAGNEVRVEMTAMQLRQRPEYNPNASGTTTTSGSAKD